MPSRAAPFNPPLADLDPPWPEVFTLRVVLRALPELTERSVRKMDITLAAALAEIPLWIYRYFLSLDRFYRAGLRESAVAKGDAAWVWGEEGRAALRRLRPAMALLPKPLADGLTKILTASGDRVFIVNVPATLRAIGPLGDASDDRETWEAELRNDWSWLHPLTQQDADDLREFFTRALWEENLAHPAASSEGASRAASGASRWLALIETWLHAARVGAQKSGQPQAAEAVNLYATQLRQAVPWTELTRIAGPGAARPITAAQSAELDALADDPGRLETLLGRMVLRERSRVRLLETLTLTDFRETLDLLGVDLAHPAAVLHLDAELRRAFPKFAAPPVWVAWLEQARGAELDALRQHLRPAAPAAAPEEAPPRRLPRRPARRPPARPATKKKK